MRPHARRACFARESDWGFLGRDAAYEFLNGLPVSASYCVDCLSQLVGKPVKMINVSLRETGIVRNLWNGTHHLSRRLCRFHTLEKRVNHTGGSEATGTGAAQPSASDRFRNRARLLASKHRDGECESRPLPTWLLTQILPPWSSTNFRHSPAAEGDFIGTSPQVLFEAVPVSPETLSILDPANGLLFDVCLRSPVSRRWSDAQPSQAVGANALRR